LPALQTSQLTFNRTSPNEFRQCSRPFLPATYRFVSLRLSIRLRHRFRKERWASSKACSASLSSSSWVWLRDCCCSTCSSGTRTEVRNPTHVNQRGSQLTLVFSLPNLSWLPTTSFLSRLHSFAGLLPTVLFGPFFGPAPSHTNSYWDSCPPGSSQVRNRDAPYRRHVEWF